MNYLDDIRINKFITAIMNQIHTESEALAVKEEILDHLSCLVEEYIERDFTEDEAIEKALLQMGDPNMIGYSFTNPDVMKKRQFNLYLFKITGYVLLLGIFFSLIIFAKNKSEAVDFLDGFDLVFINIFNTINMIFGLNYTAIAQKTKTFDIDFTPLMIIWPVKSKRNIKINDLGYYIFIGLIFGPVILAFPVMMILGLFESHGVIITIILLVLGILATYFIIHSEAYRIPKIIIVEEGIIIKGKLIPWVAITKFKFFDNYMNKSDYKYLELHNPMGLRLAPKIKIHKNQVETVKKIISMH